MEEKEKKEEEGTGRKIKYVLTHVTWEIGKQRAVWLQKLRMKADTKYSP